MRTLQLIAALLISTCTFSQASFDSTKIRSKILKVFAEIAETDSDTLAELYPLSANFRKLKKASVIELTELTNHPKVHVRIYALHALIWKSQKYAWQLLQKNAADTVNWLLLPVEDGIIPKTFIDELLDNVITSPDNIYLDENQKAYIAALKIKRRQSRINFTIQQYLKE
jgi:hypothetical protein